MIVFKSKLCSHNSFDINEKYIVPIRYKAASPQRFAAIILFMVFFPKVPIIIAQG